MDRLSGCRRYIFVFLGSLSVYQYRRSDCPDCLSWCMDSQFVCLSCLSGILNNLSECLGSFFFFSCLDGVSGFRREVT